MSLLLWGRAHNEGAYHTPLEEAKAYSTSRVSMQLGSEVNFSRESGSGLFSDVYGDLGRCFCSYNICLPRK